MSYRKFITEAYNNVAKYGTTDVDLFGDFFELKLLTKDEVKKEVIELKKYYERADIWEKRQILRLVNINLETGEKRAFFKDVMNNTNDVLVKHICSDKNLKLLK